jgi:transcriptional regulator with XRE-family HTH domain
MSLTAARQYLGWSKTELANRAGLLWSAVADIEHGRNKNPSYISVMLIYRALRRGGLKVAIEDIFPVPELPPAPTLPVAKRAKRKAQDTTERRTKDRRSSRERRKREKAELSEAA